MPRTVDAGDTVTYVLTVGNAGETTALAVVLDDPTPAGLVFLDATAPCAAGFPCALGDIASGATVVVTARFTVPANYAAATISNTATVTSNVVDPTPADNADTVVTGVVLPPPAPPPVSVIAVPLDEPWALLMLGLALIGLAWRARQVGE
jgi:large repetitive protein